MDTRVVKKKLGLKERYAAMTRGLHWDTTYQPMDKVFPYDKYEGIKIHDDIRDIFHSFLRETI